MVLRNTSYLPRLPQSTAEHLRSQWFCISVGAFSAIALAKSYNLSSLGTGGLALLGLTGFYATLIRVYEEDAARLGETPSGGLINVLSSISARTTGAIALLAVIMLLAWSQGAELALWTFVAGSFKASHWIIMFLIVSDLI